MNTGRDIIKKIVYTFFGKKNYQKAYIKGKIKDIKNGVLDEKESTFLPHFINDNSTVLDIGANYGHYSVDMSKLCSKGKIYAFEPVPFTFQVLSKILNHFNLNHIKLFNAAVSNQKGSVKMTIPVLDFGAPNTGVAYVGDNTSAKDLTVDVNTIKIDDLEIEGNLDFIKIDIEGHEPSAFIGMIETLKKHKPVILIEFSFSCLKRAGQSPNEFSDKIKNKYGYVFTNIQGENLQIVKNNNPSDGYYFLIPTEKIDNYKTILK